MGLRFASYTVVRLNQIACSFSRLYIELSSQDSRSKYNGLFCGYMKYKPKQSDITLKGRTKLKRAQEVQRTEGTIHT